MPAVGSYPESTPDLGSNPSLAHAPCHPVSAHLAAAIQKLLSDLWASITSFASVINLTDLSVQFLTAPQHAKTCGARL